MAPDFELSSHRGDKVKLSSFRGRKHVVVAFHPLAFTPVCATQMQNYETDHSWFEEHDTQVLGISVDSAPAKIAWADALGGISYDLLSDFYPHGAVAEAFGVQREGVSLNARSLSSIRTVRWCLPRSTTFPPCRTMPRYARR